MRILLTTDNIGGVWTYAINLARGLQKDRMDVCLAVTGNPLTNSQVRELDFTQWYYINVKQEWMHEPWLDQERAGEWLLWLKHKIKPDLVHLNSYSFGSLPWNIPVVITAHSCILSWWEAVKKEPLPTDLLMYKERISRGIQSADVVVGPSRAMMRSVEKYYEPLKSKTVIYNGGDSSQYSGEVKEDFIFCMGRLWDEGKNIKLILKAAPEIDYQIYIAGDANGLDVENIPENIHFIGHIPQVEISQWLSKAAIYLLPVIYEPFGYTFIEAAFSGCAIITGNIESMRELWEDTVLYTDTGNSKELSSLVNSLMKNKNQRQSLAEKARERALSMYTSDRMTTEYLSLYRNLAESSVTSNLEYKEK